MNKNEIDPSVIIYTVGGKVATQCRMKRTNYKEYTRRTDLLFTAWTKAYLDMVTALL